MPTTPDTIVLVHGLWMTPRSWEEWVSYYEAKGYRVITPTYPGFEVEVEVEALRENPEPIATATVPATVAQIAGEIRPNSHGSVPIRCRSIPSCRLLLVNGSRKGAQGLAIARSGTLVTDCNLLFRLAHPSCGRGVQRQRRVRGRVDFPRRFPTL